MVQREFRGVKDKLQKELFRDFEGIYEHGPWCQGVKEKGAPDSKQNKTSALTWKVKRSDVEEELKLQLARRREKTTYEKDCCS